jgi:hypothetical protein
MKQIYVFGLCPNATFKSSRGGGTRSLSELDAECEMRE